MLPNHHHKTFALIIAAALLLGLASLSFAQSPTPAKNYGPYPPPHNNHITDIANLLNNDDKQLLKQRLASIETETNVEIVVVTINQLADYPGSANTTIERFARGLFDAYAIGNMPQNNGILLLVSHKDRKARIELGDAYTRNHDQQAAAIMNNRIIPRFKENDYRSGIRAGVEAIISQFAWNNSSTPTTRRNPPNHPFNVFINLYSETSLEAYAAFAAVFLLICISLLRKGKRGWGWVIVGLILVVIMAIIRVGVSFIQHLAKNTNSAPNSATHTSFFGSSHSRGLSGSSFSGGGFSGGGFGGFSGGGGGGFGGGFSGGGGASGGW